METPFSFDIETSGLGSGESYITCLGLASLNGIVQCAAHTSNLELAALQRFSRGMTEMASGEPFFFITYNGIEFDYPFIRKRLESHERPSDSIYLPNQLDIFPYAKQLHGSKISKDYFFQTYLNMYIPKAAPAAFLARSFSYGVNTEDVMMDNLQHNAIDLITTLRGYKKLQSFPDFQKYEKEVRESWNQNPKK